MSVKKRHPKTNAEGYDLVLAHFGGRGAGTKLAQALGVSRQITARWKLYGVPVKYLPRLRDITGLTSEQIFPEHF